MNYTPLEFVTKQQYERMGRVMLVGLITVEVYVYLIYYLVKLLK